MDRKIRTLRYVLWAVIFSAGVFTVASSILQPRHRQVDFLTYYTAAQAWAQGDSPYELANLSRTAGHEIGFSFTYPPIVLPFFRLFTLMSFPVAAGVWVMLKLCALAALIWVWRRYFIPKVDPLLLGVLLAFGFNHSLANDFLGGNVTVIVQLLLWSGLALMLRRKPVPGACLVALASAFKFTPFVFAVLPVVLDHRDRRNLLAVTVGVIVFAGLIAGPVAFSPDSLDAYMQQFQAEARVDGANKWQPFGLHLITRVMSKAMKTGVPAWGPVGVWLAYLGSLALVSSRPVSAAWRQQRKTELLMYLVIVYALVILPPKPYILVVLIVPVLWVFPTFFRNVDSGNLLTVVLFSLQSSTDWPAGLGLPLTNHFLPWTVMLFVWILYCLLYDERGAEQGATEQAARNDKGEGLGIPR